VFDPKFLYQDGERIIVDIRKAALAGAREVEVTFDKEANTIAVDIRKSKKGVK
jgi:hypothetical protein